MVLSLPPQWQLNNSSCLLGLLFSSTITPAFVLCLCVPATAFKHRAVSLIESSSKASSALSVFCGIISCKLPHSHCCCPAAWLPLRSFYLSCWSLSVGRCPYISIQSLFPPCLSWLLKLFIPLFQSFESFFCRAQDYFLAVTAVSHWVRQDFKKKRCSSDPWKYTSVMVVWYHRLYTVNGRSICDITHWLVD